MTHELGPGRRLKSQLGEWYEHEQVAAEVARAVAAERERAVGILNDCRRAAAEANDLRVYSVVDGLAAAIRDSAQAHGQTPGSAID